MKNNYSYLKDTSFLQQLINYPILTYFIKITFLDWEENPIKSIEQKVLNASITVDGSSSIRRTGSFSFILQDESVEDMFLINKKIDIEIGYQNPFDKYSEYSVLWFPQGVYVITDYSLSHGLDGTTVSLQLKDKMCLLNGECGGTLPASVVFDNYDTIDENGDIVIIRPTIYQIIRQLVNHFGGQQLGKIIISDLDLKVKQAMKWAGTTPLYFLQKTGQYYVTTSAAEYQDLYNNGWRDVDGSPFAQQSNVGFIYTDFTYPGDLIGDAGQSVVDILQEIKKVLGNYEYFYDLDGNFVFQQIKNYLNNTESKYVLDSLNHNNFIPDYLSSARQAYLLERDNGKVAFSFDKGNEDLIISYNNSPQINMIKNDFVVWGTRTTTDGTDIPIRYHLAIDKRPNIGNTYYAFKLLDEEDGIEKWHVPIKFTGRFKFPITGAKEVFYLDASTNDIYKWDRDENGNYGYIKINAEIKRVTTTDWRTQLYFQGVAAQPFGTESNYYYTELKNEWPKIYDIKEDQKNIVKEIAYNNIRAFNQNYFTSGRTTVGYYYYNITDKKIYKCLIRGSFNLTNFQLQDMKNIIQPTNVSNNTTINIYKKVDKGWINKSDFKEQAVKNPGAIDFYLDFIDSSEKISKFSVSNIGRRTTVLNEDKNANCVFESWIPDVVLLKIVTPGQTGDMADMKEECRKKGQNFYQVPDYIYDSLAEGGRMNSCYQVIRQLLHEYTNYNQSISLQTLPIYFLQPNTGIYVKDEETGIEGNYLINSLSYSIGNDNTLNINAFKILEKI